MLHVNLDVRVLREGAVGTGWVARRVRVPICARVRQAHVVGRGGILAPRQVTRVIVVQIRVRASVGAASQLDLRKQVGVAIAVYVARADETSAVVVIGVIVHVLVVNEIIESWARRHYRSSRTRGRAANVIRRHPYHPIAR